MMIDTTDQVLEYGSRRIPYRLHVQERKRLRIVVSPSMDVDAYAPNTSTDDEILSAVRSKARWIARQLDEIEEFHPLPTPHRFVSGETFTYLGRQYRLRVRKGGRSEAKLKGRFLYVSCEETGDTDAIRMVIDNWYRDHAEAVFRRYMDQWYQVASRHGVPEPTMVIRKMRTRWGSCTSKGRITLNLHLIQAPVHCIEYVIMHELCHLKHHDHSKAYYRLLGRCMPDWERRKRNLASVAIIADTRSTG